MNRKNLKRFVLFLAFGVLLQFFGGLSVMAGRKAATCLPDDLREIQYSAVRSHFSEQENGSMLCGEWGCGKVINPCENEAKVSTSLLLRHLHMHNIVCNDKEIKGLAKRLQDRGYVEVLNSCYWKCLYCNHYLRAHYSLRNHFKVRHPEVKLSEDRVADPIVRMRGLSRVRELPIQANSTGALPSLMIIQSLDQLESIGIRPTEEEGGSFLVPVLPLNLPEEGLGLPQISELPIGQPSVLSVDQYDRFDVFDQLENPLRVLSNDEESEEQRDVSVSLPSLSEVLSRPFELPVEGVRLAEANIADDQVEDGENTLITRLLGRIERMNKIIEEGARKLEEKEKEAQGLRGQLELERSLQVQAEARERLTGKKRLRRQMKNASVQVSGEGLLPNKRRRQSL